MTTIACTAGEMACDSCWTDANAAIGTHKDKITVLKSGALLGEAGDNDSRAVVKLLQNVKNFDQMPSALKLAACCVDYCAVILFPDGDMAQVSIERHDEAKYTAQAWPVNRGMTAVGSGALIALGCMIAGKTAGEAVALACDWDPNTRAPVHVHTCKERVKSPPARPCTRSKKSRRKGRR